MNRKMSAVSNTHTKITASERMILNKETIHALSKETILNPDYVLDSYQTGHKTKAFGACTLYSKRSVLDIDIEQTPDVMLMV